LKIVFKNTAWCITYIGKSFCIVFSHFDLTRHRDSWMLTSNIILHFMIIICLFNQSGNVVCFLFSVALNLYSSLSVLLHVVLLSLISISNTLFLATSGAFIATKNITLPFATSYSSSFSSPLPPPILPPHSSYSPSSSSLPSSSSSSTIYDSSFSLVNWWSNT